MEDINNSIVSSFGETLISSGFDIATEYLELALDAVTDNETLREIPIVGSIIRVKNAVVSVRDRHLLKKTLEFVKQVNCGNIPEEKREEYRKKIIENDKNMQRELEHILLLIDNFVDGAKSKILAQFYLKYINGDSEWKDFCIFGEILDTISIYDFDTLKYMYKIKYLHANEAAEVNAISLFRLSSVGLIQNLSGIQSSINGEKNVIALITDVGKTFYKVMCGII